MCVGFILWDVEINNDFEDITLATRINLCITCYYSRTSDSFWVFARSEDSNVR
jgi:hypothetical protein